MTAMPTPGQTVGPFFGHALPHPGAEVLVDPGDPSAVRLHGVVRDGAGDPVPDALLEIWQPDPQGRIAQRPGSLHRDGHTFTGWGRTATNAAGKFTFTTVEPGRTAPDAARFIAMTVFARGLLNRLFTRVYLPDDPGLAAAPLLGSLAPERRQTLVATRDDAGLAFDVVLQGTDETVFLTFPGPTRDREGWGP